MAITKSLRELLLALNKGVLEGGAFCDEDRIDFVFQMFDFINNSAKLFLSQITETRKIFINTGILLNI